MLVATMKQLLHGVCDRFGAQLLQLLQRNLVVHYQAARGSGLKEVQQDVQKAAANAVTHEVNKAAA